MEANSRIFQSDKVPFLQELTWMLLYLYSYMFPFSMSLYELVTLLKPFELQQESGEYLISKKQQLESTKVAISYHVIFNPKFWHCTFWGDTVG